MPALARQDTEGRHGLRAKSRGPHSSCIVLEHAARPPLECEWACDTTMRVETVNLYYRTVGTVLMDVRVNREVATFTSSVFYLTGALPSHFTLFTPVRISCILRVFYVLRSYYGTTCHLIPEPQ